MWEALFRDRAGNLELPVVPDQGVVAVLMPRAAHLHAAHPQLDVRLALLEVPQHEDPVREELFAEGRDPAAVRGGDLRDQERRRAEGLQETEEMEQVAARVVEVAQAVQGRQAVDGHEVEAIDADALVDVLPQDVQPILRQLLVAMLEADLADVEDVQLHRIEARHAQLRHRRSEVLLALLEGDVEGLRSRLDVLVEDGKGEGGLHRARRAGDEDDGPARNPSAEGLVEAFDVGLESVHGGPRERAGTRYKGMPRRLSDAKSGALGRIRGPHRKVHRA